jgi:hypothetical protein
MLSITLYLPTEAAAQNRMPENGRSGVPFCVSNLVGATLKVAEAFVGRRD